jgi:hypothetical protein
MQQDLVSFLESSTMSNVVIVVLHPVTGNPLEQRPDVTLVHQSPAWGLDLLCRSLMLVSPIAAAPHMQLIIPLTNFAYYFLENQMSSSRSFMELYQYYFHLLGKYSLLCTGPFIGQLRACHLSLSGHQGVTLREVTLADETAISNMCPLGLFSSLHFL